MSNIYSHGSVASSNRIRRRFEIPRGSTPKVLDGQSVKPSDTLAVIEVAHTHKMLDIAEALNLPPQRIEKTLVKNQGDRIEEGDVLAVRKLLFGLSKREVTAPLSGTVLRITDGQMLIEGTRERVEVQSTIPGKVSVVEPDKFVEVVANVAQIQIPWGDGGLAFGTLRLMDSEPSLDDPDPGAFTIDHRGAIVAIGCPLTQEFVEAAIEIQVRGLIASSIHASDVAALRKADFPIGLTQGFGHRAMSTHIFGMLEAFNVRELIMDMGDASDWRERPPEIIIPIAQQGPLQQADLQESNFDIQFTVRQEVRILQRPYFGEIGTITALPDEKRRLQSGLFKAGATVQTESGETIFIPFANLEHLG